MSMNEMVRVTAGEFGREVGRFQDLALTRPVIITRNGRDRTVMISVEEYRRLKRRDRRVLGAEDFTEEQVEAIRRSEPPPESAAFNHEWKP
jgi:PHD/YefM family antitoxin component YafN of YafNO toxin-antitoxin module